MEDYLSSINIFGSTESNNDYFKLDLSKEFFGEKESEIFNFNDLSKTEIDENVSKSNFEKEIDETISKNEKEIEIIDENVSKFNFEKEIHEKESEIKQSGFDVSKLTKIIEKQNNFINYLIKKEKKKEFENYKFQEGKKITTTLEKKEKNKIEPEKKIQHL
jgi:hypothetical protein